MRHVMFPRRNQFVQQFLVPGNTVMEFTWQSEQKVYFASLATERWSTFQLRPETQKIILHTLSSSIP